jgi:hypothetical protein
MASRPDPAEIFSALFKTSDAARDSASAIGGNTAPSSAVRWRKANLERDFRRDE